MKKLTMVFRNSETDIWSLGIILYALLCGGLPFDDDDEEVMKKLILKGDYEEPEWLSDGAFDTKVTQHAPERLIISTLDSP
jgi:serine/threonine protein kinase